MRFATLVGMSALLVSSCASEPSCENELLGRWASPDGNTAAVAFARNCGATVGANYQVSIISSTETLSGAGNTLVVDQIPSHSDKLDPVWNGNSSVTIPIPAGSRVFVRNDKVGGIRVTFQPL